MDEFSINTKSPFQQDFENKVKEQKSFIQQNTERYNINVSPEEYQTLNEMNKITGDPYKTATAYTYSKELGIGFDEAWQRMDELNSVFVGPQFETKSAEKWYTTVKDHFVAGVNTTKMSELGNKLMEAQRTGNKQLEKATLEAYDALLKDNDALMRQNKEFWGDDLLNCAAESAPFTFSGMGLSAIPYIGPALSFAYSSNQMTGLEYISMVSNGIKPETARKIAPIAGTLEGVVEVSLGNIAGSIGAKFGEQAAGEFLRKNVVKKVTTEVAKKLHYNGAFIKMGEIAMRNSMENVEEGAEELIQEVISLVSGAIANSIDGNGQTMTTAEIAQDLWENAKGGFLGSILLGSPTLIINSKAAIKDYKALKQDAESIASKESFIKKAEENPVFEGLDEDVKKQTINDIWERNSNKREESFRRQEADLAEAYTAEDFIEAVEKEEDEQGNVISETIPEIYRTDNGNLFTETNKIDDNHYKFQAGDGSKSNGKSYGYIDYTVNDDEGTVTINNFKMAEHRESLRNEMFIDFAKEVEGYDIIWNPKGKLAKDIKENLININPRGKEAGLNFIDNENVTDVEDTNTRLSIARELADKTNLTKEQQKSFIAIMETAAKRMGKNLAQYKEDTFGASIIANEEEKNHVEKALSDKLRGDIDFFKNGLTEKKAKELKLKSNQIDVVNNALSNVDENTKEALIEYALEKGNKQNNLTAEQKTLAEKALAENSELKKVFDFATGITSQTAKGAQLQRETINGFRAVIYAAENADFSTFVHELAHVWRKQLDGEMLDKVEKAFNIEEHKWTRSDEENFARSFEQYLFTGKAKNSALKEIFQQLAQFMRDIYQTLENLQAQGGIKINDEIVTIFDSLLGNDDSALILAEQAVEAVTKEKEFIENKNATEKKELQEKKVEEKQLYKKVDTTTSEAVESIVSDNTLTEETKVEAVTQAAGEERSRQIILDIAKNNYTKDEYEQLKKWDTETLLSHEQDIKDKVSLYDMFPLFQIIGEKGAKALDEAYEETIRMDNLNIAKEMESAGKDAKTIRLATGWEKGADGYWKYEIGDIKIKENPIYKTDEGTFKLTKLFDAIEAEEIFKAYPLLKDTVLQIQQMPAGKLGMFSEPNDWFPSGILTLSSNFLKSENPEFTKLYDDFKENNKDWKEYEKKVAEYDEKKLSAEEFLNWKKTVWENTEGYKYYNDLLMGRIVPRIVEKLSGEKVISHELQHAIQTLEGFAKGSNTESIPLQRRYLLERDLSSVYSKIKSDKELYEKAKKYVDESKKLELNFNSTDENILKKYQEVEAIKLNDDNLTSLWTELQNIQRKYDLVYTTGVERLFDFTYLDFESQNAQEALRNAFNAFKRNSYEDYQNASGEVESRNVEKRYGMTIQERREQLLAETEDVPRNAQIVLFQEGNDEKFVANNFEDFSKTVKEIIDKKEYDYYGIRADSTDLYRIDDIAFKSHNLFQDQQYDEDNNPTLKKGEGIYSKWFDAGELNGTSAILLSDGIEEINEEDIKSYAESVSNTYNYNEAGKFIYLLGTNNQESGNDYNEVIMEDAKVLAILKIKNALDSNNPILFQTEEEIRKQYENTDKWMKAPNGADTKLTEKQWLQVRTENFKNWFGDWENDPQNASKVVDENGEPLVIYHGSNHWFNEFNNGKEIQHSKAPKGSIFATDNREAAISYTGYYGDKDPNSRRNVILDADSPEHEKLSWGIYRKGGIYEMFANIRKPFEVDFEGNLFETEDGFYDINEEVKWVLENGNGKYDGLIIRNIKDYGLIDTKDIKEAPAFTDIVGFNSNQFKSADQNKGTFDNSNPSILFQTEEDLRSMAMSFDNWMDFMDFYESALFLEENEKDAIPKDADAGWYQNYWEMVHDITPTTQQQEEIEQKEYLNNDTTEEDPVTKDAIFNHELKFKKGMLEEFLRQINYVSDVDLSQYDPEEGQIIAEVKDRINRLKNRAVISNALRVANGKPLTDKMRKGILTAMRNATRDYRAIYSILMNDPRFTVAENETGIDELKKRAEDVHLEVDLSLLSPTERQRIADDIKEKEIADQIRKGTFTFGDDAEFYIKRLDAQLKNKQKEIEELTKERDTDYKNIEDAMIRDVLKKYGEMLAIKDELETKKMNVPSKLNRQIESASKYNRDRSGLKAKYDTIFRAYKDAEKAITVTAEVKESLNKIENLQKVKEEYRDLRKTERAIADLKNLRKKLIKRTMRSVKFTNVDYESGKALIAIQRIFDPNLTQGINTWIGKEQVNAREIWSDWATGTEEERKIMYNLLQKSSRGIELMSILESTKNQDDFNRMSEKDKKSLETFFAKTDWIKELRLKQLRGEREGSIQLDIHEEERVHGTGEMDYNGNEKLTSDIVAVYSDEVAELIEKYFPQDLIEKINSKPFQYWSIGEMEEFAQQFNEVYKDGKNKLNAKKMRQEADAYRLREMIESQVRNTGIVINPDDPEDVKQKKQEKINKILGISGTIRGTQADKDKRHSKINAILHGYQDANIRRVARILDGYNEGTCTNLLYWQENDCFNRKEKAKDRRYDKITKVMNENNIKIEDLFKKIEIEVAPNIKQNFSIDEILFFAQAYHNNVEYQKEQKKQGIKPSAITEETSFEACCYGNLMTSEEKEKYLTADRNAIEAEKARLYALELARINGDKQAEEELKKVSLDTHDDNGNLILPGTDAMKAECNNRYDNIMNAYKTLDDKFKKLQEAIAEDYSTEFERMNKASIEEFNAPVWREKWYLPLIRLDGIGDTHESRVKADLLGVSSGTGAAGTEKGFTVKRIKIKPLNQTAVETGLYKTWADSVERTEHFVAYASYIRELNRVFLNKDAAPLKQRIEGRYGNGMLKYIDSYIHEVANPNNGEPVKDFDKTVRMLRGNTAPAYLAWKASSILKQALSSPAPYAQFISPIEYAKAAAKLCNENTRRAIEAKSEFMKNRSFDPIVDIIAEQQLKANNPVNAGLKKFQTMGMAGLEWIDYVCVAPGWLAIYEKEYNEQQKTAEQRYQNRVAELTEQNESKSFADRLSRKEIEAQAQEEIDDDIELAAVNKADDCVRLAQPSNRKVDLAPMFKNGSEVQKALLQFQTALNVIWQNIRYDIPYAARQGEYKQIVGMTMGYMAAGIAMGMLTEGIDKDDEATENLRKFIYYSLTQFTDAVPVVGSATTNLTEKIVTGKSGYTSTTDVFPTFTKMTQGVKALTDADYKKAVEKFTEALALSAGLPYSGTKEALRVFGVGDGDGNPDFYPQALMGRRK